MRKFKFCYLLLLSNYFSFPVLALSPACLEHLNQIICISSEHPKLRMPGIEGIEYRQNRSCERVPDNILSPIMEAASYIPDELDSLVCELKKFTVEAAPVQFGGYTQTLYMRIGAEPETLTGKPMDLTI